jgi:hypothetical protein
MKKQLLTTLCFALLTVTCYSQWINSVTVVPSNPSTIDTVRIIVNSDFSSGTCNTSTQGLSQTGNNFSAYTLHCLGALTVICNDEDTFYLGVLPAGNYNFNVTVDQGFGFPNCSPGIVPGPNQSTQFTVINPSSILYKDLQKYGYALTPNPAKNAVTLKVMDGTQIKNSVLEIFATDGKKVLEETDLYNNAEINLKLPKGIYVYRLRNENEVGEGQSLIVD